MQIELNYKGVGRMLKSKEMWETIKGYTDDVKQRCGEGYEASTRTGRSRIRGSVITATPEARKNNSENNTLLKAVQG